MASSRTGGRLVFIVGVLALSAVACGSSSSSSPTTAASTTATPTTVAAAAPTTTIGASTTTTSLPAPTQSILQLAQSEGQLTTLLKLLDTAGLTATLQGDGPFTLIAPSDAAFAKMNPDTLDRISKAPEVLKQIVQYHVVPERITTTDVKNGAVTTLEGSTLALAEGSRLPTVNGLTVTRGARATNGTILVIESVLLPVDLKLP